MFPSNTEYSSFVPDQLLTSDDLNTLFRYLDEQGRLSRANLIGIGILCGLELRTKSDGTSITVTKGTGVTSEGYLVSFPGLEFTSHIPFAADQEIYYGKFVDDTGNQRLNLWELKQEAAVEGATPLTLDFLNGDGNEDQRKVVLMFVELYLELDKNCNPESCDDLGQTVHVNQRVLLASKMDVEDLHLDAGLGSSYFHAGFTALPQLSLPRFDVPASKLTSAAGIFTAYKNLLPAADIASFGMALTNLWNFTKDSLAADYGTINPFSSFTHAFEWLNTNPISPADLITLQYVYDHYADLIAAYEELRQVGMRTVGACCPDSDLFPRHLLLGQAIEDPHLVPVPLRHGFQASPIHQCDGESGQLRSLFRRLVLMTQAFDVPAPQMTPGTDTGIRITPSRLGPDPLSEKAMPWYYPATVPVPGPFYSWWNYHKTRAGEANGSLGYHAHSYATRDDVRTPLAYDLEPYNFLRIEGHVGKPVAHALSNLQQQVLRRRLPVHIVALALGNDASGTNIADPAALIALHTQFETLKTEILCCLRAQARYWATIDTGDAFKQPGKAADYNVFHWVGGRRTFEKTARNPELLMGLMQAMAAPQNNLQSSGTTPETAPSHSVRRSSGVEAAGKMEAGMVHGGNSAQAGAIPETLANSRKGQDLVLNLGEEAVAGIGLKWLGYVAENDTDLSFIPAPDGPTLDIAQVEHWALIILDQIQELIVALQAEDLLSLDVDTVETRRDALSEALNSLSDLVEAYLAAQIPVAILKTYLNDSYHDEAEIIGTLMPGMSEADAHTLVRVFYNVGEAEIGSLISSLARTQGNLTSQRAVVNTTLAKIDPDGMMIPRAREVIAENDPFFTEMRDRLRNFACLCAVESFRQLRETLAQWIDHVKGFNLFANFARKHPGIQHKAGVPMGGTFILVYHRAARPGANDGAEAIARRLGINMEALGQGSVDPVILTAAQALSEGVVVADFYLPYVCCSDQAPIQFQVLENPPPPDNVTLVLEPNAQTGTLDYSVGDSGFYEFAPFPPGGTLDNAIPELGVVSPSAGSWQFRPAMTAARLGTDDTLELAFTYSRQSVSSTPVDVRIHNLPEAVITNDSPRDAYTVGDELILSSVVVRAETLRWVIEKPSGITENVADVPQLAPYTLDEAGIYTFVLHAKQDATARVAISNEIAIFAQGETVTPSLALEPNPTTGDHRYSVGDSNRYAFSFSPAGGTLEGASPEVGVTKNNAGDFIFQPSAAAAALGGEEVLMVEFRYTVEGTPSDPVRVRILALPSVTITPDPDRPLYQVGETVTWTAQINRVDRLTWSVSAPSGKTNTSGGVVKLPVPLVEHGLWTFAAEARQLTTGRITSDVKTIEVARKGDGELTDVSDCGSLQPLVEEFEKLESVDPEGFDLFERRVLIEMGVKERFAQLSNLTNESVEKQLAAFQVGTDGSWVPEIVAIMDQINELLANRRSKVSRTLLIAMYRLLGNLLLYINCISGKDLSKEEEEAMNRLAEHIKGDRSGVDIEAKGLNDKDIEIITSWKKDVELALAGQVRAADTARKPRYVQRLRKIHKAF